MTDEATAGEGSGCARDLSSQGRTLKEGNVNLSIDYHTPFLKKKAFPKSTTIFTFNIARF